MLSRAESYSTDWGKAGSDPQSVPDTVYKRNVLLAAVQHKFK